LLADITAHVVRQVAGSKFGDADDPAAGIYHLAAAGDASWFDYANFVLTLANAAQPAIKLVAKTVIPVASSAFPTAAKRPLNSRLETSKLQKTFGLHLPDWKIGVARLLREIEHEITH
jgi:dTDP-4-dehydrorhamnose reductase